jgi:hypothetical protein
MGYYHHSVLARIDCVDLHFRLRRGTDPLQQISVEQNAHRKTRDAFSWKKNATTWNQTLRLDLQSCCWFEQCIRHVYIHRFAAEALNLPQKYMTIV